MTKATVIGAGAMGTVMARIAEGNGARVALLARDCEVQELIVARENRLYLPGIQLAEGITPTDNAQAALANTELIVSAVPCQYLRAAWERLAVHVPRGVPICSVTKGIEIGTIKRPSEIIAELAPDNPCAVLSGPSVAPELARCLPATVAVASASPAVAEFVQSVLSTSGLVSSWPGRSRT